MHRILKPMLLLVVLQCCHTSRQQQYLHYLYSCIPKSQLASMSELGNHHGKGHNLLFFHCFLYNTISVQYNVHDLSQPFLLSSSSLLLDFLTLAKTRNRFLFLCISFDINLILQSMFCDLLTDNFLSIKIAFVRVAKLSLLFRPCLQQV